MGKNINKSPTDSEVGRVADAPEIVLCHSFDLLKKHQFPIASEVFHLHICYLYDFWTITAVFNGWHICDTLPERQTEQNQEKKKLR